MFWYQPYGIAVLLHLSALYSRRCFAAISEWFNLAILPLAVDCMEQSQKARQRHTVGKLRLVSIV